MLDYLEIREEQLAPVVESGNVIGKILPEVTEELGLGEDITICTGALDQAAGAIGAGNIREECSRNNRCSTCSVCTCIQTSI